MIAFHANTNTRIQTHSQQISIDYKYTPSERVYNVLFIELLIDDACLFVFFLSCLAC